MSDEEQSRSVEVIRADIDYWVDVLRARTGDVLTYTIEDRAPEGLGPDQDNKRGAIMEQLDLLACEFELAGGGTIEFFQTGADSTIREVLRLKQTREFLRRQPDRELDESARSKRRITLQGIADLLRELGVENER